MSRSRLYVGNISRRSRTSDIEYLFSKYGRVIDIDLKHDYGFVEFEDSRDAEDAVYELDGYRLDGVRLVVERARHPRGGYRGDDRRPAPGSGKCYNCGKEGHWARDCSAGDWSNRCYRCGKDGHLERNCTSDLRRSSRSASPRRAVSRSASRERSRSRSRSARSRSRSPPHNDENTSNNIAMSDEPPAPAPTEPTEDSVPVEKPIESEPAAAVIDAAAAAE